MQRKVVIIDDNPITVRSLTQTIHWESLGCAVAGTATDGESGRELVLKMLPDILLLDIRMPGIDGLSMLEEVRASVPECKVIIITGYDQFQYASRAIKLSVFDYVLKPIDNAELEKVISRAVGEINNRRQQAAVVQRAADMTAQIQLVSLLMNDSRSGQNVHQMLRDANLFSDRYLITLVTAQGEQPLSPTSVTAADETIARLGMRAVTLFLFDALVIYLMLEEADADWRDQAAALAHALHEALPVPVNIGASALMASHHQMRLAYQQARQTVWEQTFQSNGRELGIWPNDEGNSDALAQMQKRIEQLVQDADPNDESAIEQTAHTLYELSGKQYSNLRALVSLYTMLLCKRFPSGSSGDIDRERSTALFVSGEQDVVNCLKRLYHSLNTARSDSQCSLTTRSVLEYIRIHAAENLRLSDIANRFHINTNYLSLLIRRETGDTFHDHYIRAKMDVAYTLLADPRMHVADVAHAVGYSNYVSFYNAFKNATHMTPTEYRNQVVPQGEEESESER